MRALLFIFASLSFIISSYARPNVAPSIEWLADQSDAVGVYSVVSVHIEHAPEATDPSKQQWGRWGDATMELELVDAKKGSPPAKLKSIYNLHPTDSNADIRREIAKGHQMLCFLSAVSGTHKPKLRYVINLDSPARHGPHTPFSSVFTVLYSRDDIISILDARLKRAAAGNSADERKFQVEVPFDTPAHRVLYGGSTCYLIVPEDLRPK